MNVGKLNDWLQIFGIFGVVGSLVFVGLQLRQSQEIAIASQYQARLEAASMHYTALLQNDTGLRAVGGDLLAVLLADETLSPELKAWLSAQPVEELAFRAIAAILFLKSHDNVYFQYQAGFLSDEAWAALREQLRGGLHDPRMWVRSVYQENPAIWRESYQALIEELIREGGADAGAGDDA